MIKRAEIKPMVIPVISHAYGIDEEFDLTERATGLFEEISYEIFRCSHGIVKYEQDSFVRVARIPQLDKDIISAPKESRMAYYPGLIHYLDWNPGVSVFDRVNEGFQGELWLFGEWFDDFAKLYIYGKGYIPSMGIPYDRPASHHLAIFVERLKNKMRTNDWPFEGDARKWLSRLPEKYWENIK